VDDHQHPHQQCLPQRRCHRSRQRAGPHKVSSSQTTQNIRLLTPSSDNADEASYLINTFYPTAWQRIRAAEATLGIADNNKLHIQMMNAKWGSGDPDAALTDLTFAMYDDHRYVKYDTSVAENRAAYLAASCADDRSGNTPTVVGEWSLSVADDAQDSSDFSLNNADAAQWYQKWWAAQVLAYEKVDGWIYWTWKVNNIGGQVRKSFFSLKSFGIVY
jgi:hypothetical protein